MEFRQRVYGVWLAGGAARVLPPTPKGLVRTPSADGSPRPARPHRGWAPPPAIEVPHGPPVEALLERGFGAFPFRLERLDRFTVAKARMTVCTPACRPAGGRAPRANGCLFRLFAPSRPLVVELRVWSRTAEGPRGGRIRLAERIREQLWPLCSQPWTPRTSPRPGGSSASWGPRPYRPRPPGGEATVARLLKRHRTRGLTAGEAAEALRAPRSPQQARPQPRPGSGRRRSPSARA